jgi:hypothetical protein
MTKHCYNCGTPWSLSGQPGREERCIKCGADLHVCLNCVHYDPKAAWQCKERRAEQVYDKDRSNFCEYFDFVKRSWQPPEKVNPREQKARDELRKLFG